MKSIARKIFCLTLALLPVLLLTACSEVPAAGMVDLKGESELRQIAQEECPPSTFVRMERQRNKNICHFTDNACGFAFTISSFASESTFEGLKISFSKIETETQDYADEPFAEGYVFQPEAKTKGQPQQSDSNLGKHDAADSDDRYLSASKTSVSSLLSAASIVWISGVALLLGFYIYTYLALKKRLGTAIRVSRGVFESELVKSAFVLGIFKPIIYVPCGMNEEQFRSAVLHERTHIRRHDHQIKALSLLLLCIHWFNPILWLSFALMSSDMEQSCDEAVIKKLWSHGIPLDEIKRGYGKMLISAAENNLKMLTPSFGGTHIKERMKNIMRYNARRHLRSLTAFILAAAILIIPTACSFFTKSSSPAPESSAEAAVVMPEESYDILFAGTVYSADITELDLSGKNLTSIEGIGQFQNLRVLNLSGNPQIKDYSPLLGCTELRRLYIKQIEYTPGNENHPVMDYESMKVFAALPNLEVLTVGIVKAECLPVLKEFKSLKRFIYTAPEDGLNYIDILAALPPTIEEINRVSLNLPATEETARIVEIISRLPNLTELNLEIGTEIATDYGKTEGIDLSPLKNIKRLNVYVEADNPSVLAPLTQLEELDLSMGIYSDKVKKDCLSILGSFTSLKKLTLKIHTRENSQAIDLSFLKNLKELKSLKYDPLCNLDESVISELTWLEVFTVNDGKDIDFIRNMKGLKTLTIEENLSDLSLIAQMDSLECLNIWNPSPSLTDLSPLEGCKNLKKFAIYMSSVTDYSPLGNIPSLKSLALDNVVIDDISFLRKLNGIEELTFMYADVNDKTVFDDLPNLKYLNFYMFVDDYDYGWLWSFADTHPDVTVVVAATDLGHAKG